MATKGAKALLEPQAQRLYANGHSLKSISEQLGVSVTSLSKWKEETKVPGLPVDEWDRARSQKRSNIQRLRDLWENQLEYVEGEPANARDSRMIDALSKLGSLLERWDKMEKAQRVAEEVDRVVKKAGLTEETAANIRTSILGIGS